MIFPNELRPGDTILLIAPSSPLAEDQPLSDIVRNVESLGFCVKAGASCTASPMACGYTVAPQIRADDINQGFADPGIAALWCVRGGETAWHLLPHLDYSVIAAHPKPFLGFSDITTLHLAIQQNTSLVTYHGPTANRTLSFDPFSWQSLQAALYAKGDLTIENPPDEPVKTLRPGRASGILTGGNLSLVTQTAGTREQVDTRDKILYLEDVGEEVYAIERMLSQLHRSGILSSASGLVFGAFKGCSNNRNPSYGTEELLRDLFRDWPKPVLYNIRSAHCRPMVTLPLGAPCTIDGDAGTITMHLSR